MKLNIKEIKQTIKWAEKEISYWQTFVNDCKKEILKLKKLKGRGKLK